MTSEVLLMNRSAVALAADSATTATYWNGRKYVTRYFKGANKIFHISSTCPVGMMIYGTAEIQNVPWEVLAKSYRDNQHGQSYDTVEEYAASFFRFIEDATVIFPLDYQKKGIIRLTSQARR